MCSSGRSSLCSATHPASSSRSCGDADADVPLDAEVAEQRGDRAERQALGAAGGVRLRRADVAADQLRRQQQLGLALDLLPLQRVVAVAAPDPVGALEDAEVDPGAAGRAGLDLQAGVPAAQLVQQPVDGQRLLVDARASRSAGCRHQRSRGCGPTSGTRCRTRSAARRAARAGSRRPPGSPRLRPCWCRAVGGIRLPVARIQSGCSRARSESGLTISGSTQRPNCRPSPVTWSTSGCRPFGQMPSSTYQSPRPAWSSRRPRNQPSSSTNRSAPDLGGRVGERLQLVQVEVEVDRFPGVQYDGTRGVRVVRPGPQVLVEPRRTAGPVRRRTSRRSTGCCRRPPAASRPSPGRSSSPPPITAYPLMPRSAYERWLPLHAVCTAQTSPVPKSKPRRAGDEQQGRVGAGAAAAVVADVRALRERVPLRDAARRCGDRSGRAARSPRSGPAARAPARRPCTASSPVLVRSALARTRPGIGQLDGEVDLQGRVCVLGA